MKRTLLVSALLAIALTACGKKEEAAPVPAATTAAPAVTPGSSDVAKPADTAAPPTAPGADAAASAEHPDPQAEQKK